MQNKKGVIEVICGPMFSGKTEELLRRLKRSIIAKNKLIRNFPVALILASSSIFMGNNQNTYAEGIMSATPTTVVVAEFINESDATWWKPKYWN